MQLDDEGRSQTTTVRALATTFDHQLLAWAALKNLRIHRPCPFATIEEVKKMPEKEVAIAKYFAQLEPPKVARPKIKERLMKMTATEIEEEMVTRLNTPGPWEFIKQIQQGPARPLDVMDGDSVEPE